MKMDLSVLKKIRMHHKKRRTKLAYEICKIYSNYFYVQKTVSSLTA